MHDQTNSQLCNILKRLHVLYRKSLRVCIGKFRTRFNAIRHEIKVDLILHCISKNSESNKLLQYTNTYCNLVMTPNLPQNNI
jgi:hypothetical protein